MKHTESKIQIDCAKEIEGLYNLDRRSVQRTISGIKKKYKGYTFKINETTRK